VQLAQPCKAIVCELLGPIQKQRIGIAQIHDHLRLGEALAARSAA
jgi:hypothetical protein